MTQANINKAVEAVQERYDSYIAWKSEGNMERAEVCLSDGVAYMDMFHILTGDYISIEDGKAVVLHGKG